MSKRTAEEALRDELASTQELEKRLEERWTRRNHRLTVARQDLEATATEMHAAHDWAVALETALAAIALPEEDPEQDVAP
jgi:hypothetical protein